MRIFGDDRSNGHFNPTVILLNLTVAGTKEEIFLYNFRLFPDPTIEQIESLRNDRCRFSDAFPRKSLPLPRKCDSKVGS